MANKRMISADIITSDSFVMMSHKAQALYLQCIINSDDDGLVDNMRILLRTLDLKNATLNELITKKFVLDLGDGIYCIKHWFINNNKVPSDRYRPTKYPEKLDLLIIKENKAYSLNKDERSSVNNLYTDRVQSVNKLYTL